MVTVDVLDDDVPPPEKLRQVCARRQDAQEVGRDAVNDRHRRQQRGAFVERDGADDWRITRRSDHHAGDERRALGVVVELSVVAVVAGATSTATGVSDVAVA